MTNSSHWICLPAVASTSTISPPRIETASPAGTLPPSQVAGELHSPPPFPLLRSTAASVWTLRRRLARSQQKFRLVTKLISVENILRSEKWRERRGSNSQPLP